MGRFSDVGWYELKPWTRNIFMLDFLGCDSFKEGEGRGEEGRKEGRGKGALKHREEKIPPRSDLYCRLEWKRQ